MEYTIETARRLADELRAIPAKDPSQRRLDKQAMVRELAKELIALQQRGYTIEEVAGSSSGSRDASSRSRVRPRSTPRPAEAAERQAIEEAERAKTSEAITPQPKEVPTFAEFATTFMATYATTNNKPSKPVARRFES